MILQYASYHFNKILHPLGAVNRVVLPAGLRIF